MNRWETEVWQQWVQVYQWRHLCPVLSADSQGQLAGDAACCAECHRAGDRGPAASVGQRLQLRAASGIKAEGWGRYEGRLVAVDYGYACDSEKAMAQERATLEQLDMRKG